MKVPHKCVTVTVGLPFSCSFAHTGKHEVIVCVLLGAFHFPWPCAMVFLERAMELTRYKNNTFMRCGVTTGSCAAAAAKAAAAALLTGECVHAVTITVPAGFTLTLDISDCRREGDTVTCAVKKDAGDDPDITDGILVLASARPTDGGVDIDGGEGVGRVTKPGLNQPVGAAAINSVPRAMIVREVSEVCAAAGYTGGVALVISIPGGLELARRTFNPRMGIEGGLSVLGTSGIVEPMSSAALIDTLKLEIKMLSAAGKRSVLLTIGNYGDKFADGILRLGKDSRVKCSNFLGDAIEAAVLSGFERILLIGHIGKLVKLGIGVTNTHSSYGDGRMETLAACAVRADAPIEAVREILECVTVDAALDILRRYGHLQPAMAELGRRIGATLSHKTPDTIQTGFICFSGEEILIQSENAKELCEKWYIS